MLLFEILAVIGAIFVLFLSGISTARKAVGFGKTAGRLAGHAGRKAMYIMDQSQAAQNRALSITQMRDVLSRRLLVLRATMGKTRVLVSAAREAWQRVSRVLAYVGI